MPPKASAGSKKKPASGLAQKKAAAKEAAAKPSARKAISRKGKENAAVMAAVADSSTDTATTISAAASGDSQAENTMLRGEFIILTFCFANFFLFLAQVTALRHEVEVLREAAAAPAASSSSTKELAPIGRPNKKINNVNIKEAMEIDTDDYDNICVSYSFLFALSIL